MESLVKIADSLGFVQSEQSNLVVDSAKRLFFVNPEQLNIKIGASSAADIFILHTDDRSSQVSFDLEDSAVLNFVEVYLCGVESKMQTTQAKGSISKSTAVALDSLNATYNISLQGDHSSAEIDTLQLTNGEQKSNLKINMRHETTDSSSRSLSKCVASGNSSIGFNGLVYVAQDAQRTAAEQNSRSLFLSDKAHIKAEPQLEIYADDVKCSHGATVGQIDTDAILYMRQRGLTEEQARRVQMEGFIRDIVERSSFAELREPIMQLVSAKLELM